MSKRGSLASVPFLWLLLAFSNPDLVAKDPKLEGAESTQQHVRLVFLGDTGTGKERQQRVSSLIHRTSKLIDLQKVFLVGDNIYGEGEEKYFGSRFKDIYSPLLNDGVEFHAALGNHDVKKCKAARQEPVPRDANAYQKAGNCWVEQQLKFKEFGYINSFRYYSVQIGSQERHLAEVFVLDSNTLDSSQGKLNWQKQRDQAQLDWFRDALSSSDALWRIVIFHHPIYTPTAKHKPEQRMRQQLEPLMEGKVDAVIQGHNHLYARVKPQKGIRYFVSGAGGKAPYKFKPDPLTVNRQDRGEFNHFLFVDLTEERFQYCVIDEQENVRDGGWFARLTRADTDEPFPSGACPPLGH